MCLSIPMKILSLNEYEAQCEAHGEKRTVSLLMMADDNVKVGDHLMVQLGFAVRVLSENEARESWQMYDEIFSMLDSDNNAS